MNLSKCRRLLPVLLFSCLLLASCHINDESTDQKISMIHLGTEACIAGDTIYFISDTWEQSCKFLMYIDTSKGTSGPLCGKAECTHQGNSCNACLNMDGSAYGLGFWQNKLYWISDKFSEKNGYLGRYLYSVNPDGSGRKEVRQLITPEDQDRMLTGNNLVLYQNGYAIECGSRQNVVSGISENTMEIKAYSLSGKKDLELYQNTVSGTGRINMEGIGDTLYYLVTSQKSAEDGQEWVQDASLGLYSYSFLSGETNCLYHGKTDFSPWEFMVIDQQVFFSCINDRNHHNALYRLDLESQCITEIYGFSDMGDGMSYLTDDGLFRREFLSGDLTEEYSFNISYDGEEKWSQKSHNLMTKEDGSPLIYNFIGQVGDTFYIKFTGYGNEEQLPELVAAYQKDEAEASIVWQNEAAEKLLNENKKIWEDKNNQVRLKLVLFPETEEPIVIHHPGDVEEYDQYFVKIIIINPTEEKLLTVKILREANGITAGETRMDHFPAKTTAAVTDLPLNQLYFLNVPIEEDGVTVHVSLIATTESSEIIETEEEINIPIRIETE